MQNNSDYLSRMIKYSTKFAKMNLKNFRYYLSIVGTNVTVNRITSGEFREALGAAYIYDGTDTSTKTDVFQKRIVINRSQLVNDYKTATNDIEAYTNENFYRIGDQIEFQTNGVHFKYKVTEIEQFDPYNEILYKLTLSGFEEFKIAQE